MTVARFGAIAHEALLRWNSRERTPPASIAEFVATEREEEFLDLDLTYYDLSPSTSDLLEQWLSRYQSHFVQIVADDAQA